LCKKQLVGRLQALYEVLCTVPNIIKGVFMFYSTGYLCALALMLVAVAALFNGAISVYEFIACILFGTATGVYFVYREMKGE